MGNLGQVSLWMLGGCLSPRCVQHLSKEPRAPAVQGGQGQWGSAQDWKAQRQRIKLALSVAPPGSRAGSEITRHIVCPRFGLFCSHASLPLQRKDGTSCTCPAQPFLFPNVSCKASSHAGEVSVFPEGWLPPEPRTLLPGFLGVTLKVNRGP